MTATWFALTSLDPTESNVTKVLVLHPGEMGAAVGACLTGAGHDVYWRPAGRSDQTRTRAQRAGLRACPEPAQCDVIVSLCPPAAALQTARSIGSFSGLYIDANAISPSLARMVAERVSAAGAQYVDGGVIGSLPRQAGTTRLYLSGAGAAEAAALFKGTSLDARVLLESPFAASAMKMAYAAGTKISAAVLLAARAAARSLGVEEALIAEWALSQPTLTDAYVRASEAASAKGWRWEEEMRQIAATFAAVEQPSELGHGAAQVFGQFRRPATDRVPDSAR